MAAMPLPTGRCSTRLSTPLQAPPGSLFTTAGALALVIPSMPAWWWLQMEPKIPSTVWDVSSPAIRAWASFAMLTPVILAPLGSPRLTRSRFQYSQHRVIDDCWEAQAASQQCSGACRTQLSASCLRSSEYRVLDSRLELSSFVRYRCSSPCNPVNPVNPV